MTKIRAIANDTNRLLTEQHSSYILVYTDVVNLLTGEVAINLASNVPPETVANYLGVVLEVGPEVKALLTELFTDKPLRLPGPPPEGAAPDAPPVLVEVPTERAVEMVATVLLTNLRLRVQRHSPIIQAGG